MRTNLVVAIEPVGRDLPHLVERIEQVRAQNLFAVGAVEALDVGVLIGLAGLDEAQLDVLLLAPVGKLWLVSSGPLSQRIAAGRPCKSIICARNVITRAAGMLTAMSIPSPPRLASSMTLRVRNTRPL